MFTTDSDMDIAEEEPDAGVRTEHIIEGESDGSPARFSGDSDLYIDTAVPPNPHRARS